VAALSLHEIIMKQKTVPVEKVLFCVLLVMSVVATEMGVTMEPETMSVLVSIACSVVTVLWAVLAARLLK